MSHRSSTVGQWTPLSEKLGEKTTALFVAFFGGRYGERIVSWMTTFSTVRMRNAFSLTVLVSFFGMLTVVRFDRH